MSNTIRSKIKLPSDIADGGGLGVKTKSVTVDMLGIENYYRVNPKMSYGTAIAAVSVVFDFEAGYSISANYDASVHRKPEIENIKDAISLFESENLEISIKLDPTYDLEFNNWSLTAKNREVFEEVLNASDEWRGRDLSDEKMHCPIVYTYDDDCRDVAYGLLGNIDGQKRKYPETGFTEEMVTDLHSQIKKAIAEVFAEKTQ